MIAPTIVSLLTLATANVADGRPMQLAGQDAGSQLPSGTLHGIRRALQAGELLHAYLIACYLFVIEWGVAAHEYAICQHPRD